MNLAFALNRRRTCFQCVPQRLPECTSSASTLRPRLIPSLAKKKLAQPVENSLVTPGPRGDESNPLRQRGSRDVLTSLTLRP
jgi:hypothetical protein